MSPVPAILDHILRVPAREWRSSLFEVFRWVDFPDILIIDSADFAVQDRMFITIIITTTMRRIGLTGVLVILIKNGALKVLVHGGTEENPIARRVIEIGGAALLFVFGLVFLLAQLSGLFGELAKPLPRGIRGTIEDLLVDLSRKKYLLVSRTGQTSLGEASA